MPSSPSERKNEEEIVTLTLVAASTGRSDTIPFPPDATLGDVLELCRALFGDGGGGDVALYRDGRRLSGSPSGTTLRAAGVQDGDVLAVQSAAEAAEAEAEAGTAPRPTHPSSSSSSSSSSSAPAAAQGISGGGGGGGGGGGLDFSSLLGGGGVGGGRQPSSAASGVSGGAGTIDFGALLHGSASTSTSTSAPITETVPPPPPKYYPGMNLNEAILYNPHPSTFVTLLKSRDHLQKELNYYRPAVAEKLRAARWDHADAVRIWQEEMVRGGIEAAVSKTERYHREQSMKRRLEQDPDDVEAKEYFAAQTRQRQIREQYEHTMEEYPESLGRVLMLYIETKINGHPVQAFCDSGAQATIMSKKCAAECGIADWIDTRFEGTAVGVGTGKILGRIHLVQLQIGNYHFPCSVTVMDDPKPPAMPGQPAPTEMPFLLGLDMMKRHTCVMDLERGCLKFRLEPGKFMEAPFLHEKDLDESKGGTKGFDVEAANRRIAEMERRGEKEGEGKAEGDNDGEKKKPGDDKKDGDGDVAMS